MVPKDLVQEIEVLGHAVYTYSQFILVGVKDFIQVTVGHR